MPLGTVPVSCLSRFRARHCSRRHICQHQASGRTANGNASALTGTDAMMRMAWYGEMIPLPTMGRRKSGSDRTSLMVRTNAHTKYRLLGSIVQKVGCRRPYAHD